MSNNIDPAETIMRDAMSHMMPDELRTITEDIIYRARCRYDSQHQRAWTEALHALCDSLGAAGIFGPNRECDPRKRFSQDDEQ